MTLDSYKHVIVAHWLDHKPMLDMSPAGKRTSKPGVEVCGAWRCQLDSDQSLGAAAAEILPFA